MNVVKNIDLVNQKDDLSCTIACVAMLSGYSFDYVRKIAKHNSLIAPLNTIETLQLLCEVKVLGMHKPDEILESGDLYLLTVPSLNSVGFHNIILDLREGLKNVFDPQKGRENKRFYTQKNLKNWSTTIEIITESSFGDNRF